MCIANQNEIKAVIFDIDGVLTDGKIHIDKNGNEIKNFNLVDADSINLLKKEGYLVFAVTGEKTEISTFFKNRFPWNEFIMGCKEKDEAIESIKGKYCISLDEMCYIGDGLYDIPALEKVGFAICPNNAINAVKAICNVVLKTSGGNGVVAEIYEILKAKKSCECVPLRVINQLDILLERYPALKSIRDDILKGFILLKDTLKDGGKILLAGNGGSAADTEHIVGELMKSFKIKRPINNELAKELSRVDLNRGNVLAQKLETPFSAISLMGHESLSSAILNDTDGKLAIAQQMLGIGAAKDVCFAISTSGNSENVVYGAVLAKALKMKVISLTGDSGGELLKYSDVSVRVPESETYKIQELHLPIYHALCLMLEEYFFGKENN